jgi:alkylation response protein AidB-like acyl-CoA dehydrogenase
MMAGTKTGRAPPLPTVVTIAGSRDNAAADLREKVRAILPQIAANADRTEQERRVPDENMELIRQTGFFRVFQPKRYGGLEGRIQQFGPCLVDISEACSATGWVAGLLAQHVYAIALYSRKTQDEIWGNGGEDLIGSSVAPVGKAELVDGGILLSGKFGFSSGCDHAQWYMLGFRHPGFEPPFDKHYALVPRSDLTIIDDWHTVGLSGTGSKTLIVDKAFVPEHRCESIVALNNGNSRGFGSNDNPIYHGAFGPHFGVGFSAVAIGTVRRMATLYAEKQKSRTKVYTGQSAIARSPAVMRLGKAVHTNEAAMAFLEKQWRSIDERHLSGQLPNLDEMSLWRTSGGFQIQLSIQAADELFGGSGGSAWFTSNEMQRLWRNVHMCGAHAGTDYDTCSEIYGRRLLGLELDPTL